LQVEVVGSHLSPAVVRNDRLSSSGRDVRNSVTRDPARDFILQRKSRISVVVRIGPQLRAVLGVDLAAR
jgi:hypothetical protein